MARSIGLPAGRGRLRRATWTLRTRALPREGQARARMARGLPERLRLGAVRANAQPGSPNAGYTGVSEAQDPTSPIPVRQRRRHHHGPALRRPTPSIPTWRSPTRRRRQPSRWPSRPLRRRSAAAAGPAGCCSPSWAPPRLRRRRPRWSRSASSDTAPPRATPKPRIDVAWKEAVESLGVLGIEANLAETPLEPASGFRIQGHLVRSCATWRPSRPGPATQSTRWRMTTWPGRLGASAVTDEVKATTTVPERLGYHLRRAWLRRPATTGAPAERPRPGLRLAAPGGSGVSSPGGSAA